MKAKYARFTNKERDTLFFFYQRLYMRNIFSGVYFLKPINNPNAGQPLPGESATYFQPDVFRTEISRLSQRMQIDYVSICFELKKIHAIKVFGTSQLIGRNGHNRPKAQYYKQLFLDYPL
jgi:hypothetical protein